MAPIVECTPVNSMTVGCSYKPCSQGLHPATIQGQLAIDPRFSSLAVLSPAMAGGGRGREFFSMVSLLYFLIISPVQGRLTLLNPGSITEAGRTYLCPNVRANS